MNSRVRTHLLFLLIVSCSVAIAGCGKTGDKDKDKASQDKAGGGTKSGDQKKPAVAKKTAEPAPKLAAVDLTGMLTKAGRTAKTKVVMMAPEGAKVTESYGDVIVSAGKGFALAIATSANDIAKDKKFQLKNTVQKHKRFVVDTPDAIIGESVMMRRKSFFLTANHKVGKETFGCKSKRGAVSFTEAQAKVMLTACNSIKGAP